MSNELGRIALLCIPIRCCIPTRAFPVPPLSALALLWQRATPDPLQFAIASSSTLSCFWGTGWGCGTGACRGTCSGLTGADAGGACLASQLRSSVAQASMPGCAALSAVKPRWQSTLITNGCAHSLDLPSEDHRTSLLQPSQCRLQPFSGGCTVPSLQIQPC